MAPPAGNDSGDMRALFDDLEQQWLGLALEERAAEIADLGASAYADVTLAGRVHASVGRPVAVTCLGGHRITGTIERAGADFFVAGQWAVSLGAVGVLDGLADRSVPEEARPVTASLTLGSVLRNLAAATFVFTDGAHTTGRVARVGRDFAEVERHSGTVVVPRSALAAVRGVREDAS